MPVPSSINDLSTTAGSNSPGGSETPGDGDNYLRSHAAFIATLRDKLNGNADTGTVKSATFSGTMAGAASWSGLQTFAAGLKTANAASADATVLDWYQEGTFTPVPYGSSTPGTGTYATQEGFYTRVGNTVHVYIRVTWTAHTGTGLLYFSGLPFAATAPGMLVGTLSTGSVTQTAVAGISTGAPTSSTEVRGFDSNSQSMELAPLSGNQGLYLSGHYRV